MTAVAFFLFFCVALQKSHFISFAFNLTEKKLSASPVSFVRHFIVCMHLMAMAKCITETMIQSTFDNFSVWRIFIVFL